MHWIETLAKATEKLERWQLIVPEFDLDILNRAEIKNRFTEALWILCTSGCNENRIVEEILVISITTKIYVNYIYEEDTAE